MAIDAHSPIVTVTNHDNQEAQHEGLANWGRPLWRRGCTQGGDTSPLAPLAKGKAGSSEWGRGRIFHRLCQRVTSFTVLSQRAQESHGLTDHIGNRQGCETLGDARILASIGPAWLTRVSIAYDDKLLWVTPGTYLVGVAWSEYGYHRDTTSGRDMSNTRIRRDHTACRPDGPYNLPEVAADVVSSQSVGDSGSLGDAAFSPY